MRWLIAGLLATVLAPIQLQAACCYFSAKNTDILQPAQKVFLTWDPELKAETFTVQPKFEGNALDFGMVIPTPSQPKLHEMPRDFFKHIAYYSILKRREFPQSKLLPFPLETGLSFGIRLGDEAQSAKAGSEPKRAPAIKILETGVVGNLDYKIIEAGRADDL